MNIQTFQKNLPTILKHNIVPFVWGFQGIGKTQSVGQVAKKLGIGFVHLHLATQEVGDLVGLLVHGEDGTVKHARPEWFPTFGEGIIFLDELNRAHPDVIQAMFSFITSKTIHRHVLPPGWKIVAAGNYQSDQFTVTDTSDAAWNSRFCHLHLEPTVVEFTEFAESKGCASIASFISEHSACLETKPKDIESSKVVVTPDRRSWIEMIGPLENEDLDEETRFELYQGIVGQVATVAFFAHKKTATKVIKITDILRDYNKVRGRVLEANKAGDTRFDILSAPIDELVHKLDLKPDLLSLANVTQLHSFFLDIPLELLSKATKKLGSMTFDHKDALLNCPQFMEQLLKRAA
jgi:hypothetical protein